MLQERTERLALPQVAEKILKQICLAEDPVKAADLVAGFEVEAAVSLVDNLDQLTAAIVVTVFRFRTLGGSSGYEYRFAKNFVKRAEELQIRGTAGLCYARDLVFRETGYLAGT